MATYNEQIGHLKATLTKTFPERMIRPHMRQSLDHLAELLGPGWEVVSTKHNLPLPNLLTLLVRYEPGDEYYVFSFIDDGHTMTLQTQTIRPVF